MIRPAVITDEISQEFEHALDVMAEHGVRAAELRGLWDTNILDLSDEQLRRAREALREREMTVCAVASPLFKCHLDEAAASPRRPGRPREEQLALLERALRIAEYFNTSLIRIFTYWRDGELTDRVFEQIVEGLRPAVRRAKAAGVVLGVENEHACYVGTGAQTARLLAALPSQALQAVWDPGNAYFGGEKPYPDGYEQVRGAVVHVHVKDAVGAAEEKPRFTVVGVGEIDFRGQFEALVRDGYRGYCSLETHFKPEGGTPEQATRLCLPGMLRIMEEAGALTGN